jgi:hypothetical protein
VPVLLGTKLGIGLIGGAMAHYTNASASERDGGQGGDR